MKDLLEGIDRIAGKTLRIRYTDYLIATFVHHRATGWTFAATAERTPDGWIPHVVALRGDLSKSLVDAPPKCSEGEALALAQEVLDEVVASGPDDDGDRVYAAAILAYSAKRGWFEGPDAMHEEHLINLGISKVEGGQA